MSGGLGPPDAQDWPDYSLIDQPQTLQVMFYPRRDYWPPPFDASDHFVLVDAGVTIHCRFYPCSEEAPSILFFHGNGEVVCDYDGIAPIYNDLGINLFVADYRGYGASSGFPSFSAMIGDCHAVLKAFTEILASNGRCDLLYVMGRSLGSHSAAELAARYPEQLRGLIVESGFASMGRMWNRLSSRVDPNLLTKMIEAHQRKIKSITLPLLILHGEWDTLVSPLAAQEFYEEVGSQDKNLVTIPGAGHNDIMLVGMEPYFSALKDFVFAKPWRKQG